MSKENTLVISDFRKLPAYQDARSKQETLVKDNPYVEIVDSKTFEEAKKHRTSLRVGRTDLQKGEKLIASKVTEFRKDVKEETSKLIAITLTHEEKQQAEIDRYVKEKEAEKAEAQRIEQARIDGIKNKIISYRLKYNDLIKKCILANMLDLINEIKGVEIECEEFQQDFDLVKEQLLDAADEKLEQLEDAEKARLENERLKKEREELEAERKKLDKQREEENAKLQAERDRIAKEREDENAKLQKERDDLQAEKDRIAKEKADEDAKKKAQADELERQKKAKAEEEAREKAAIELKARKESMEKLGYQLINNEFVFGNIIIELSEVEQPGEFYGHDLPKFERLVDGETKRIEALKPDKEKLLSELTSIDVKPKKLSLSTDQADILYTQFTVELALLVEKFKNEVSEL